MVRKNKIFSILFASILALNVSVSSLSAFSAVEEAGKAKTVHSQTAEVKDYKSVDPLDLVANPQKYLNKPILIDADFDKFSVLGLDYKPAFKDSKNYIAFLIRRPDQTATVMPLSELKLFIKRDKAEKLIDLESGDNVQITGVVFSVALNDPWVEVDNVKVICSKSLEKKAAAKAQATKENGKKSVKSPASIKKTPISK